MKRLIAETAKDGSEVISLDMDDSNVNKKLLKQITDSIVDVFSHHINSVAGEEIGKAMVDPAIGSEAEKLASKAANDIKRKMPVSKDDEGSLNIFFRSILAVKKIIGVGDEFVKLSYDYIVKSVLGEPTAEVENKLINFALRGCDIKEPSVVVSSQQKTAPTKKNKSKFTAKNILIGTGIGLAVATVAKFVYDYFKSKKKKKESEERMMKEL